MKKNYLKNCLKTVLITAIFSLPISGIAQTVTYDFERDTAGSPPANVSAVSGTFTTNYDVARTKTLNFTALASTAATDNTAIVNLTSFPSATDYSVTWKENYNLATSATITVPAAPRSGVLLRGGTATNTGNTGMKQGYLFQPSSAQNQMRIFRSNASGFTNLTTVTLAARGAGLDRWYRATVIGTALKFEYSDDNITFVTTNSTTDATYTSGTTQFVVGFAQPITGLFVDNIVQTINGTTTYGFIPGSTTTSGWSAGVPSSSLEAFVNNDYITSGDLTAKKLTVNAGKSFTIASGNNVTVTNEVINNGSFVVQNNANLIQTNSVANTGNITVNRNSNSLFRSDYTMWSSPVANQNLLAFSPLTSNTSLITTPLTTVNRFYTYDPITNKYVAIPDPAFATATFAQGTGFLIRMPNTDPATNYDAGTGTLAYPGMFAGIPNNGTLSVTSLTAGQYVAVGNPYPSTISAATFFTQNPNAGTTLYFWRRTNGAPTGAGTAYATYNNLGGTSVTLSSPTPNGIIQVGQGFIVNTGTATAINFDNTMRVANNVNQFFKTKLVAQPDRVWINLTNATGAFSQMLVGYLDGATTGEDAGIDGKYINDAATALTSDIAGGEYVIQGRPAFDATDVVNLNFKTAAAGDFTIAKDHVDGLFASGQDIYLVDKTAGTETNLQTDAYTFTAVAGTDNARFSLKYQKTLKVGASAFNETSVKVYRTNGVLNVSSGAADISNIKVFDIQGRLLAELNNVNASSASIKNLKATNQVLVVKVTGTDNSVVAKKVLN